MFGFRDKEKDQLEENMEEIKQLINQEDSQQDSNLSGDGFPDNGDLSQNQDDDFAGFDSQDAQQGTRPNFDEPQEDSSSDNGTNSFDTPQKDFNSQENTGFEQNSENEESFNDEFGDTPSQQNNPDPSRKREQPGNTQERAEKQPVNQKPQRQQKEVKDNIEERRTSKESKDSGLDTKIPEPAKTKQIDVPEIDKGPLFLRRGKFEKAQEMIQEMRYISQEIEDVVNRLESGIREDQETEREAKELLHTLEEDRSQVKGIISPEEES